MTGPAPTPPVPTDTDPWRPEAVWIERSEADTPLARRIAARLPGVPVHLVDDPAVAEPHDFGAGKRRLLVQRNRGSFLQACPAGTTGLVCCNYLVMHVATNCPYDCSYCFLQDYLRNNPATKVFTNPDDGLAELDTVLRAHPDRTFRVGTGELADSLALDHLTDLSVDLVSFCAARHNVLLELKTKSTQIANLLHLDPRDRVVVAWSVNAPAIMAGEEPGTAPFAARIAAAERLATAGYRIGFHFDPIVAHDGWEEGYRTTIGALFRRLDPRRVAWVSLGSLRLTPTLKAAIKARPYHSRILDAELVPGPDGKERVWRGLRVKIYRRLLGWLREIDPQLPVYICMEPPGVWETVVGGAPTDRTLARRLTEAHR